MQWLGWQVSVPSERCKHVFVRTDLRPVMRCPTGVVGLFCVCASAEQLDGAVPVARHRLEQAWVIDGAPVALQADEQAYGVSKAKGKPKEDKLKGEFSLRDCATITTPDREPSVLVVFSLLSKPARSLSTDSAIALQDRSISLQLIVPTLLPVSWRMLYLYRRERYF